MSDNPSTDRVDLKPCPFCGKEAGPPYGNPGQWVVACRDCGGEVAYFAERQQAIDAWNTRPSGEPPAKYVEGGKCPTCGHCDNCDGHGIVSGTNANSDVFSDCPVCRPLTKVDDEPVNFTTPEYPRQCTATRFTSDDARCSKDMGHAGAHDYDHGGEWISSPLNGREKL